MVGPDVGAAVVGGPTAAVGAPVSGAEVGVAVRGPFLPIFERNGAIVGLSVRVAVGLPVLELFRFFKFKSNSPRLRWLVPPRMPPSVSGWAVDRVLTTARVYTIIEIFMAVC